MSWLAVVVLSVFSSAYFVFMLHLSGFIDYFLKTPVFCRILPFLLFFIIVAAIVKRLSEPPGSGKVRFASVFFISITGTVLFGGFIGADFISDISEEEKRTLNRFPRRLPFHENFPGEFNLFVDDRVALRGDAFKLYSRVKPYMLDKFNLKGQGLFGLENWLFYNSEDDTVGNFQGVNGYTDSGLLFLKKTVDEVYDFCRENNIGFVFILAPNKSSVYPEYYPDFIKRLDTVSSYERINGYLLKHSSAPVTDVFGAIMPNKGQYSLYYKEDTHWNTVGAYFAWQKAADLLKRQIPGFRPVEFESVSRCDAKSPYRDLIDFTGGTLYDYPPTNEFCVNNPVKLETIQALDREKNIMGHIRTSNEDGLKIMIFHDSFMVLMQNFIYESASEVKNIWFYRTSPLAYKQDILEFKPDIIVWEMLERYAVAVMRGDMFHTRPGG